MYSYLSFVIKRNKTAGVAKISRAKILTSPSVACGTRLKPQTVLDKQGIRLVFLSAISETPDPKSR